LFNVLSWKIGQYSITAFLENKADKTKWACTTVYGPVEQSRKADFWAELTDIGINWNGAWVVGGDFNAIRNRREKNKVSFDHRNTQHFNAWIDAFALYKMFSNPYLFYLILSSLQFLYIIFLFLEFPNGLSMLLIELENTFYGLGCPLLPLESTI
jgi:hypothetical protein